MVDQSPEDGTALTVLLMRTIAEFCSWALQLVVPRSSIWSLGYWLCLYVEALSAAECAVELK